MSLDLKNLFDAVVEMGKRENGIAARHMDQEPAHIYHMRDGEGKIVECEAEPLPRQHQVYSFDALVAAAFLPMYFKPSKDDVFAVSAPTPKTIWYSRKGCHLTMDDRTRRDSVIWPLSLSTEIRILQALERPSPKRQSEFVRLLRIDLAASSASLSGLLASIRKLSFKTDGSSSSEISTGKRSIGKQLAKELYGVDIPEEVVVDVPVFVETGKYRQKITCAVDVDPDAEVLHLIPYPGLLERAILAAERELGSDLDEALGSNESHPGAEVRVLHGVFEGK